MDAGFFWALAGSFSALNQNQAPITTIYFATAGLILVVSVMETSYAMAYYDDLTGLPGRRALKEYLLKLHNRYTVAMVDVDHFKNFNDRYGHDVGDQVLKMLAGKLARVSGGGRAFRYGGEEFTLVFSGKPVIMVLPHLERLRKTIGKAAFTLRGEKRPRKKPKKLISNGEIQKRLSVTVSIGAAEQDGSSNDEEVIKAADQALYRAKNAGRNRVKV